MEGTASDDELIAVSHEEILQQQFAQHQRESQAKLRQGNSQDAKAEHYDDDDDNDHLHDHHGNNNNNNNDDDDEFPPEGLGGEEDVAVLRVSAEGDTDLLGRPQRPYVTPLSRPVLAAGNTQLSYAQARLYGLVDENGEVKPIDELRGEGASVAAARHQQTMDSVKNLSEPKELDLSHIEVEEDKHLTFKPARSEAAKKAMLNSRCGYDFVSRLEERGDFLDRYSAEPEKGSKTYKKMLQSAKDDYMAQLDKLACPKCKVCLLLQFLPQPTPCPTPHSPPVTLRPRHGAVGGAVVRRVLRENTVLPSV